MNRIRLPLLIALLGALFSGCRYPRYARYTSFHGDFRCEVPYSWNVMRDVEGEKYANTTFIGPFEPDFYLGVPSFSVRWYERFRPHTLPDGTLEMYSGADDFIKQTLKAVYGPNPVLPQEQHEVEVAGRKAKHFVVLSPVQVPSDRRWGVSLDGKKKTFNLRQHAYVLLPMERGFYVFVYPATKDGYDKYKKDFEHLVFSFEPVKNGPFGSPARPETRGAAKSAAR